MKSLKLTSRPMDHSSLRFCRVTQDMTDEPPETRAPSSDQVIQGTDLDRSTTEMNICCGTRPRYYIRQLTQQLLLVWDRLGHGAILSHSISVNSGHINNLGSTSTYNAAEMLRAEHQDADILSIHVQYAKTPKPIQESFGAIIRIIQEACKYPPKCLQMNTSIRHDLKPPSNVPR